MIGERTLRSGLAFRALCSGHFDSGERRRVMLEMGLAISEASSMVQSQTLCAFPQSIHLATTNKLQWSLAQDSFT